jgi:signal transduction histidine kinase
MCSVAVTKKCQATHRNSFCRHAIHTMTARNAPTQCQDGETLSRKRGHAGELDLVLATVSHELRRPLAAILGWTQLLRSGRSTDIAHGLEVIERSANQQQLLIEELLDLSCTAFTDSVASFSPIDLNDVLRNVRDAAQPAAADKKVQLVTDLAGHPVLVRGDARRLHQIFGNLVANAIKFTPSPGRITVSLSSADCDAIVEVADTGVGISPSELPRMFEPFWQAEATSRLSREGLGLGLAIVRRFVELHGGTIEAKSTGSGCGTRMAVRLPPEAQRKT